MIVSAQESFSYKKKNLLQQHLSLRVTHESTGETQPQHCCQWWQTTHSGCSAAYYASVWVETLLAASLKLEREGGREGGCEVLRSGTEELLSDPLI